MTDDLHTLGEDLVTTSARVVRWVTRSSEFTISLAAARLMARLQDAGPTRISDLAIAERSSQPTITNHVKRLEGLGLVQRTEDPNDGRVSLIDLTFAGREELGTMRYALGTEVEPYLAKVSKKDIKAIREGLEALQRLMAVEL